MTDEFDNPPPRRVRPAVIAGTGLAAAAVGGFIGASADLLIIATGYTTGSYFWCLGLAAGLAAGALSGRLLWPASSAQRQLTYALCWLVTATICGITAFGSGSSEEEQTAPIKLDQRDQATVRIVTRRNARYMVFVRLKDPAFYPSKDPVVPHFSWSLRGARAATDDAVGSREGYSNLGQFTARRGGAYEVTAAANPPAPALVNYPALLVVKLDPSVRDVAVVTVMAAFLGFLLAGCVGAILFARGMLAWRRARVAV